MLSSTGAGWDCQNGAKGKKGPPSRCPRHVWTHLGRPSRIQHPATAQEQAIRRVLGWHLHGALPTLSAVRRAFSCRRPAGLPACVLSIKSAPSNWPQLLDTSIVRPGSCCSILGRSRPFCQPQECWKQPHTSFSVGVTVKLGRPPVTRLTPADWL